MPASQPSAHASQLPSRVAGVVLVLAAEVLVVLVLVRLGQVAPFAIPMDVEAWARATPQDALAAALRWVALGAAGWLLFVSLVSVALALVGARPNVRARLLLTPRLIRRIVDGAVVASVAASVATGSGRGIAYAGTSTGPPAVTLVRDGRSADLRSLPAEATTPASTAPLPSVPVTSLPAPPVPASTLTPPVAVPSPRTVVVQAGDNLWELAAREVARLTGRDRDRLEPSDVADYWVSVCAANRDRLASGDVDLVFPGEVVELPPAR